MLWQITVASIGPQSGRKIPQPGRKDYWKRKRVCVFFALLNRAKGTGRPVPWPVEPVGTVPRSVQHFGLKNLSFSIILSSNT